MAKIKINVKKLLTKDGEKMIRLSITGMESSSTLPLQYTGSPGSVWLCGSSLYVHTENQERRDQYRQTTPGNKTAIAEYLINYDITPDLAEYLIGKIQSAGAHLHLIRDKLRVDAAIYEGETEITI